MITYRLRADLRTRWRGLILLVALVAVLGGLVVSLVAGARRTASAYPRMLRTVDHADLMVSPLSEPLRGSAYLDELRARPEIADHAVFIGVPAAALAGSPFADAVLTSRGNVRGVTLWASLDEGFGYRLEQPRLMEGRLPDPTRPHEVLADRTASRRLGLHTGDRIDLVVGPGSDDAAVAGAEQGRVVQAVVSGVGVFASEVVPFTLNDEIGVLLAGPALAASIAPLDTNYEGAAVKLAPGVDHGQFASQLVDMGAESGGAVVTDVAASAERVQGAMRPIAVALAALAVAVGAVGLIVVGHVVSRAVAVGPDERDILLSLGADRAQRRGLPLARAAVVAVLGALGSLGVALALSSRFPIGVARVAETEPGTSVDAWALALGGLSIALLVVVCGVTAALLDDRRPQDRPFVAPRLSRTAGHLGLSVAAQQGIRFAVRGGGRRPVPLRTTVWACVFAVAAAAGALTFAHSLSELVDTPARYGQGWDQAVSANIGFSAAPVGALVERFGDDPNVSAMALGNVGDVDLNGVPVSAIGLRHVRGDAGVTIVRGDFPVRPDEVALGGDTLSRLGLELGDTVQVDGGDGATSMRVVGQAVFPRLSLGGFSSMELGAGALVPDGVLPSPHVEDPSAPGYELEGRSYAFAFLRGTDRSDALEAELEAFVATGSPALLLEGDQRPSRIRDLDRVRALPAVTALILTLVVVTALAHLLLTSVASRRHELALLRALGFTDRQLRATVGWHALFVTVVAIGIGTPVGVVVGRLVWRRLADGLYAVAPPVTPWLSLVLSAAGLLVLAYVVARVPARRAARVTPASELRTP